MGTADWTPRGGGQMGDLIRARDWTATPLGAVQNWPQSLRTALGILLDSGYGMYIAWGPEFTQLYNDAYRPILGSTKHPHALGRSTQETFSEIWDFIGPMFRRVMDEGASTTAVNQLLPLNRYGYIEECYFTFSYSAIRDEGSGVGGVLVTVIETTQSVIDERRLKTLRGLSAHSSAARNTADARSLVLRTIRENSFDIPFAELLARDAIPGPEASLATQIIEDFGAVRGPVESPAWPGEFVKRGMLLPFVQAGTVEVAGYLLVGLSPRRALDASYDNFLHLVAQQSAVVLDNARAYEAERQRAEALAELDRAKTTFFSNVSHEFRTPLTLLLGPLEEVLAKKESLPKDLREPIVMAHRNGQRLLKLVNTLLDFSRIEAGRMPAKFEAADLAQLTTEVANVFHATITNGGLHYEIDCPPLRQPVSVDCEMWEKVVLNLLSNAFKYTFAGSIRVSLREEEGRVVLRVTDTGTGIPASELPHIFNRFHRAEGSRGRTFEGTGIGLALVSELVRIHGGDLSAASEEGKGSVFKVSVPYGSAELEMRKGDTSPASSAPRMSASFVQEAGRWIASEAVSTSPVATQPEGRVLIADDNADVRDYVSRILGTRFTVRAVSNGEEALAAIAEFEPDLVISDVMMPRMNGYELLTAIRGDPNLRSLAFVLLSARAGEESSLEGLEAGATDYLTKPFSERELLARVSSQVTLARLRLRIEVSERERRSAAQQAEQRFRALLTQAPASVALLSGPEHVFELVNDEFLRLVGREHESDLIGKRVIDVFPEVESQGFIGILDSVYQKAISSVGREQLVRLRTASGEWTEFFMNFAYQPVKNAAGTTEAVLFYGSDVTDLVAARTVIENSERTLRTLAESIPQLVWTCRPDGSCDYLSSQWVAYTGVPEKEQLGMAWLEVLHPDDRQRAAEAWLAATQDRGHYNLEYRIRRSDGIYRWFKTRGIPARNSAGEIEHWFGTCTDIEDQKLAERHMLEQQKLESIGLLAGGIAHDFNNLLVGVLANANLIEESLPERHPLRSMAKGIAEAGQRAAHLTRQMLDYSGKGRMFVENIDLKDLTQSTATLLFASIPKAVRLIINVDPDTPRIEGDSGQIQQVIMNLALNGAESIGEDRNGWVTLHTSRLRVDAAYLTAHNFINEAPIAGDYACIEVEDSGSGIDPASFSKIFDPFFTTKFTGRGLGLAAVLGIVRSAQGGLEVSTVIGRGTTFRVLFPAMENTLLPEVPAPLRALQNTTEKRPTVLVIDDEQIVRSTTRAALQSRGYSVILAENGMEGLQTFRNHRKEIALVLLDMSMPGMSGKEVLTDLRSIDPDLPVLIFSGFAEEQVQSHFGDCVISGFIQKPFNSYQIASVVHSLLSEPTRQM